MHSGSLFYYGLTENTLEDVVKQALYIARDTMECDAFSCMTVMDNKPELMVEKLGFLPGDGALHWYLVNWSLGNNKIESNDIGTMTDLQHKSSMIPFEVFFTKGRSNVLRRIRKNSSVSTNHLSLKTSTTKLNSSSRT